MSVNGGAATTVGSVPPTIALSNPSGDGVTWVMKFSGAGVIGGSIQDGVYDLTANGALITSAAANQAAQARATDTLYRLYGDVLGGATAAVNATDLSAFLASLGSTPGQTAYRAYWDILNGGTSSINATDLSAIEARLGKSYTGFSATICS